MTEKEYDSIKVGDTLEYTFVSGNKDYWIVTGVNKDEEKVRVIHKIDNKYKDWETKGNLLLHFYQLISSASQCSTYKVDKKDLE